MIFPLFYSTRTQPGDKLNGHRQLAALMELTDAIPAAKGVTGATIKHREDLQAGLRALLHNGEGAPARHICRDALSSLPSGAGIGWR